MRDACFGNTRINIRQRRYLGSKTRILPFIEDVLKKEKVSFSNFLDIFAGTGVVAHHFSKKADVIINDILESNYLIYLAFFGSTPIKESLLTEKINLYNSLDPLRCPSNYFSENFSETYFSKSNSALIGYIRNNIESLHQEKQINSRERAYLITSLIYALDRIANTVGHYDAFRRVRAPQTKLHLRLLDTVRSNKNRQIFQKDGNELAKEVKVDVTYIDPPYNSRQYSDAYHLLENIAGWRKQSVHGVAKKMNRDHIKSHYNLKTAGHAFSELIDNLDTKFILVSYNDMGNSGNVRSQSRISDHELISALERRGRVRVYEQPVKQFTAGKSSKADLKERIFFCRVNNQINHKPQNTPRSPNNPLKITYIKSPLNYTGGKHKLLPQLIKHFPKKIDTFYDVFCGAANVGINAKAQKTVCVDSNKKLIELLKILQSANFESLHRKIEAIIKKYSLSLSYIYGYSHYGADSSRGLGHINKKAFLRLRKAYNDPASKDKSILLLVLILYSFNNQIRFNAKGDFNLPVGKRDYNGNSRRNIAGFNALAKSKDISFIAGNFENILDYSLTKNDFVYLDPPYYLGLATYNENGGWSLEQELRLYQILNILHERKIRFALSNVIEHKGSKNESLKSWANKGKYNIHRLLYHYGNSNYQSKAKHNFTQEVLVTNY